MDQKIINLYDAYTHSALSRKEFMKQLGILAGGTALALTILPMLENNYAQAATVIDADLTEEYIVYPGAEGDVKAFSARPKGTKKVGTVLVIHENRGLNAHTIDVARRVAAEGFIAFAVDALSPFGGTPEDEDKARELIGQLDRAKNLQNYLKGLSYLRTRKDGNGRVGCVGFCWGGAMSNQLAVNDPELLAAVAYYGSQPEATDVPRIKASVLLHYAGLDERINAGIPAYEAALKANNTDYKLFVYEGVNHAFNNNTSPTRYNEAAAKLAWERTVKLFNEKLA
jgi:carboxymethylenebutenolidase